MELYQLRSFVAVAELGHLTRAAERLHVSQPAVSAQIKALEDELGVALFERTSSGMLLTSAGQKLLPEANKVVAAAQSLRSRARAIKGMVVGRARVGTVSDPDFVRVGDFLSHALEAHPLLEIELHHEVSGRGIREGARRHARRELLLRRRFASDGDCGTAGGLRVPRGGAHRLARARRQRVVGRRRRDAVDHDPGNQFAVRPGRRPLQRQAAFRPHVASKPTTRR